MSVYRWIDVFFPRFILSCLFHCSKQHEIKSISSLQRKKTNALKFSAYSITARIAENFRKKSIRKTWNKPWLHSLTWNYFVKICLYRTRIHCVDSLQGFGAEDIGMTACSLPEEVIRLWSVAELWAVGSCNKWGLPLMEPLLPGLVGFSCWVESGPVLDWRVGDDLIFGELGTETSVLVKTAAAVFGLDEDGALDAGSATGATFGVGIEMGAPLIMNLDSFNLRSWISSSWDSWSCRSSSSSCRCSASLGRRCSDCQRIGENIGFVRSGREAKQQDTFVSS